jgi:hypothetical protein
MQLLQWGHMSHAKQFLVVKNLMLQGKPYNFNVEQIVVSMSDSTTQDS